MLQALFDADSGSDGVLEGVESEAEGGVVVQNLIEELPALLDLQVVGSVECPLVDGAPRIHLFSFPLAARHEHIERYHVIDCELLGIDSLLEGLLVNDDFVSVNKVFLEFMGQNSLDGVDLVGVGHFLDNLSHFIVVVAGFDQPQGGLGGFVGGKDHVGLLAGDGGIFVGLDDQGVSSECCESIDVHSDFNFDEVSLLDVGGVLLDGGVISTDLVGGDGGGEGEAFEDGFFIIDLGKFLVDEAVAPEAEFEDLASDGYLFDEFGENL